MAARFFVDNRAVDGVAQLDGPRAGAAHGQRLADDLHLPPRPAVEVFVPVGRIQLLDVQISLVDADDGETEADLLVVSQGYAGQSRLSGSDDVPPGRHQVHRLAQRGNLHRPVRVAREQRLAGGAQRAAHHPVVASLGVGKQRREQLAGGTRRHFTSQRVGEPDAADRLAVVAQDRAGDLGQVEPVGRMNGNERVGWEKLLHFLQTEALDVESALHLADDVARHQQAGDAGDDVLGLPQPRVVAGQAELERPLPAEGADVGVDAGREGDCDLSRVGPVAGPLGVPVAAEAHQSRHAVPRDRLRPQRLGQLSRPDAAPQIDLKQAVARGDVALGEEQVVGVGGVDVRHTPAIAQDLNGLSQAFQRDIGGAQVERRRQEEEQFPHSQSLLQRRPARPTLWDRPPGLSFSATVRCRLPNAGREIAPGLDYWHQLPKTIRPI